MTVVSSADLRYLPYEPMIENIIVRVHSVTIGIAYK